MCFENINEIKCEGTESKNPALSKFYDINKYTAFKANENEPRHSEASVIELKDKSLLMAWQCHLKSDNGSNDTAPSNISLVNSYDNGKTWVNRRIQVEMKGNCVNVYSPTLLRCSDGSLALFFKRYMQLEPGKQTYASYYKITSFDEGETWSGEEVVFDNVPFGTHNHAILRISDNSLLMPVEHYEAWCASDENAKISVLRSEDGFKTMTQSNKLSVPMRGLMEPYIAQTHDGTLNMVMRNQLGSVFFSQSYDMGRTWSKPQTTGLRAPESCPNIISVPNTDAQIVIWNNSEYDPEWASHYGKRTPLTLAITRDNFKTVTDFYDIETDPDYVFTNPSTMVTSDGLFVLNYWSSKYKSNGYMGGPIDLKIATFRVRI